MSQQFFNFAGTFVGPAIRHERADLFGVGNVPIVSMVTRRKNS